MPKYSVTIGSIWRSFATVEVEAECEEAAANEAEARLHRGDFDLYVNADFPDDTEVVNIEKL